MRDEIRADVGEACDRLGTARVARRLGINVRTVDRIVSGQLVASSTTAVVEERLPSLALPAEPYARPGPKRAPLEDGARAVLLRAVDEDGRSEVARSTGVHVRTIARAALGQPVTGEVKDLLEAQLATRDAHPLTLRDRMILWRWTQRRAPVQDPPAPVTVRECLAVIGRPVSDDEIARIEAQLVRWKARPCGEGVYQLPRRRYPLAQAPRTPPTEEEIAADVAAFVKLEAEAALEL